MRKLIVITSLAATLAGGSLAQASGQGNGRSDQAGDKGKDRQADRESKRVERCERLRHVGFVAKGTFVSGDDAGVTLKVLRANRHALRSGLVVVGEEYTATPADPGRIRYVNRAGAQDAQPTDRVKVVGKLSLQRRGCSSEAFTPVATVRRVRVIAPGASDDGGTPTT